MGRLTVARVDGQPADRPPRRRSVRRCPARARHCLAGSRRSGHERDPVRGRLVHQLGQPRPGYHGEPEDGNRQLVGEQPGITPCRRPRPGCKRRAAHGRRHSRTARPRHPEPTCQARRHPVSPRAASPGPAPSAGITRRGEIAAQRPLTAIPAGEPRQPTGPICHDCSGLAGPTARPAKPSLPALPT